MEYVVEAHVAKIGDLLYSHQIILIACAHRQVGMPRAEHLLPEMRKRFADSVSVNGDSFPVCRAGSVLGGSEQQDKCGPQPP